jgi:hypothetical protein
MAASVSPDVVACPRVIGRSITPAEILSFESDFKGSIAREAQRLSPPG